MLAILRTLPSSVHLMRQGGLICRSIRKPLQESRRTGTQGPLRYRDIRTKEDDVRFFDWMADSVLVAFWYYWFMVAYYRHGPMGFHPGLDPAKFSDAELGIPPDDYDGDGEAFPGIPRDQALHVNAKCYYPDFPDFPVMNRPTNMFGLQQAPV